MLQTQPKGAMYKHLSVCVCVGGGDHLADLNTPRPYGWGKTRFLILSKSSQAWS